MSDSTFQVGKTTVRLVKGDLTEIIGAEAIVNAANSSLFGGGGVDGMIHRKGGSQILSECKKIRATEWPGGLPTGKAVITSGGDLKAKYIIHTVGPVWQGGTAGEADLLKEAYLNSLRLAVLNDLRSVAFPAISTGAYGYPIEKASCVALSAIKEFLDKENSLREVIVALFSDAALRVYEKSAKEIFK